MKKSNCLLILVLTLLGLSCSHKYNSDTLSLEFYQWNLWEDKDVAGEEVLPSCGWKDLHRGKGKLVRIPAPLEEHFPGGMAQGVYWYHCRFTLPEQWEDQPVSLQIDQAGPIITVFLNEEELGHFEGEHGPFEIHVTGTIYYVRDNHLSIRISNNPEAEQRMENGITGNILVKSGNRQIIQD